MVQEVDLAYHLDLKQLMVIIQFFQQLHQLVEASVLNQVRVVILMMQEGLEVFDSRDETKGKHQCVFESKHKTKREI